MASIFFDMAYKGLKITQLFKLSSYVLLSVKLYIKEKKVNSDRSRAFEPKTSKPIRAEWVFHNVRLDQ